MRPGLDAGLVWTFWCGLLIGLIILLLAGCAVATQADCTATAIAQQAAPAEVALPAEVARELWQRGAHSDSYVESDYGPNQECARCHARAGWQPAVADWPSDWIPPSDSYQTGPASISQADWNQIECQVCHPGALEEEFQQIAWLAVPPQGSYQVLESNDQLCLYCHAEAGLPNHEPIEINDVHRDLSCPACHDPHGGTTSCTQAGCHLTFDDACNSANGHSKPHQAVTCRACHALGDYQVDWAEQLAQWDLKVAIKAGRGSGALPISHNLTTEVECERCHTPGELPWME